MKTSSVVASIAAGVVIVGGGIFAVQALTADPGGEAHTIDDYAHSDVTETPEAVETATVEPDETVEPAPEETVTPEYSESDQIFLDWAQGILAYDGLEVTDTDLLMYLDKACAEYAAGNERPNVYPAELDTEFGDVNLIFIGAVQDGYGPGLTGTAGTYCD